MKLEFNERVTYLGKTQKGKTHAAKKVLHRIARTWDVWDERNAQILILATKEPNPPDFTRVDFPGTTYQRVNSLLAWRRSRARVVVVHPTRAEKMMGKKAYEAYFASIMDAGSGRKGRPLISFVDEAVTITEGRANGGPPSFQLIYGQGAGLKIGAHAAQQDAAFMDRRMLSQAEHFLIFPLRMRTDRKKISDIMGLEDPLPAEYPDEHGFMYSGPGWSGYVPDIEDFLWEVPDADDPTD